MRHIDRRQASIVRFLVAIVPFVAFGCGSSAPAGVGAGATEPAAAQTIGAAGGVLSSASGDVRVEIPAGAVDHDIAFSIGRLPTSPAGSVGPAVEIGPSGTTFRVPVRLTFNPAPADTAGAYFSQLAVGVFQNGTWALLDGETADPVARTVSATTTHLSIYGVIVGRCRADEVCDLNPAPYVVDRSWLFQTMYRDRIDIKSGGPARGGVAEDAIIFGKLAISPLGVVSPSGSSMQAIGDIFSDETGDQYWVRAEAPSGAGGPDDPTGGITDLYQDQYFLKRSATAWMKVSISHLVIEAIDTNGLRDIPDQCFSGACLHALHGEALFETQLFNRAGARLFGDGNVWRLDGAAAFTQPTGEHWTIGHSSWSTNVTAISAYREDEDLDVDSDGGHHAIIRLTLPLTITLPLDRVAVGETFKVHSHLGATALNLVQGESYLGVYLEDPATGGGVGVTFEGVEPVAGPGGPPPLEEPAAVCPGAPDPAAGTLQLERAALATIEAPVQVAVVVNRQGGSRGEVSAVLRSADGSATAGSDYAAVDTVVKFADGQDGSQVVLIPILQDGLLEEPESLTVTLSDPRGCAALGAQASATVTIVDDDLPPGPAPHTVGGTVRGLTGGGLVLTSNGANLPIVADGPFVFPVALPDGVSYDVRVEANPTSPIQICAIQRGTGRIAGSDVIDVEVDCAAALPPGSLDRSFGSGGLALLTAGMADSGEALAVDGEGRIVFVGGKIGSNGVQDFAVTRLTADGHPDAAFGAGGTASIDFGGDDMGRALAIQPDGKILVVGGTNPLPTGSAGTFALARLLADGSLDPQFGSGGRVTTSDFVAANAGAIQPDGGIVVAGTASFRDASGLPQRTFGVARYLPDGTLDPAFGTNGRAAPAIAGGAVGLTLGLLGDGRIAVGGLVGQGSGVACLDATGALDRGFGTEGVVTVKMALSALAVQRDHKLVIAGSRSGPAGDIDFAAMRLDDQGKPDAGFGNMAFGVGSTTIDFPGASDDDYPFALLLAPGGEIVAAGTTMDRTRSTSVGADFALARLTPAGAPDPTFGTAGRYVQDFFGESDLALAVASAPDGALVVAGSVRNGTSGGLGIVRLLP